MHKIITLATILLMGACASITNNESVPLALSFSDDSEGTCTLQNIRIYRTVDIPSTSMIQKSEDNLQYNCKTEKGRTAVGEIPSTMGGTILTLWMVDSITNQHREYPGSFIIAVKR